MNTISPAGLTLLARLDPARLMAIMARESEYVTLQGPPDASAGYAYIMDGASIGGLFYGFSGAQAQS